MEEKNIIEKLGIGSLCLYIDENEDGSTYDYFDEESVRDKEKIFNEMLEALILDTIDQEVYYLPNANTQFNKSFERKVAIIEKATGKPWEEIKELIK